MVKKRRVRLEEGKQVDADCARRLLKLLATPGEPFEFGCAEIDTKNFFRVARKKYPKKGVCIVSTWMIVDFKCNGKVMGVDEKLLCQTRLYGGCVELDLPSRFEVGRRILTTPVIAMVSPCFFITSNTAYVLSGEGFRKTISARKICAALLQSSGGVLKSIME